MAFGVSHYLGIGAGALIIGVGIFVLVARQEGWLSRLFFLLALMDGLSTILFQVSAGLEGDASALYQALYWYAFILFVTLLTIFGLVFPLPWQGDRTGATLAILVACGGIAMLAAHALRHDWFWTAEIAADGAVQYSVSPGGNVANACFSFAIGAVALKLTDDLLHRRSASHQRQAAFVLGGMTLAYAPYPAGTLARVMSTQPGVLFAGRADRMLAYWAFAFVCFALLASAILIARESSLAGRAEKRFLLATYGAVFGIAALVWLVPTLDLSRLLRMVALVAYPILLGWAIARYEVFDIDRKIRRGAMVTFAAAGLALAFLLAESVAENVLQQRVFGGFASSSMSGMAAAIVTAGAFVPVVRASRKAAAKIVPELSVDEIHTRKLEIYEHSVRGALADGILREGESRTLAALRSSLGITDSEHQQIVREALA